LPDREDVAWAMLSGCFVLIACIAMLSRAAKNGRRNVGVLVLVLFADGLERKDESKLG
jgi:hypothetical protein